MKIVGKTEYYLAEGDSVTCSVSHEIRVGREASWIRFEATTKVLEEETSTDAMKRVIEFVNDSVMEAVDAAVKKIQEKS